MARRGYPAEFPIAGGFGTVVFNFLVAAGALHSLAFFAYLVAIVWLLAMATLMFAALLFESRRGAAASPLAGEPGS
jgi:hypothetical protein